MHVLARKLKGEEFGRTRPRWQDNLRSDFKRNMVWRWTWSRLHKRRGISCL